MNSSNYETHFGFCGKQDEIIKLHEVISDKKSSGPYDLLTIASKLGLDCISTGSIFNLCTFNMQVLTFTLYTECEPDILFWQDVLKCLEVDSMKFCCETKCPSKGFYQVYNPDCLPYVYNNYAVIESNDIQIRGAYSKQAFVDLCMSKCRYKDINTVIDLAESKGYGDRVPLFLGNQLCSLYKDTRVHYVKYIDGSEHSSSCTNVFMPV